MVSLRGADFEIYDEEIDKLFLTITKQPRITSSAVLQVDDLCALIYEGVKAIMVSMMQNGLKKSRRLLVDLIAERDTNKDGFLEYQEFEDMLLENLQVGFHPKLFELIILEMMDPGRRHSKIKNELIKIYLGEGDQAGLMMDMIPQ